jgi:hypothetical protein
MMFWAIKPHITTPEIKEEKYLVYHHNCFNTFKCSRVTQEEFEHWKNFLIGIKKLSLS